ncbi:ORF66 [Betabaculovirus altermyunipunctae]|uniref:ORF66 n=1 Tax=Betabaculovirus altermyunipunctae TaxID=3051996 RepID=A0A1S5YDY6_9BBAC|nr:ORF66 [Betabaculovirus altermyunipunctae]AQQ80333.1 ORF66 [Betabaculovirus altermyunipunctae]
MTIIMGPPTFMANWELYMVRTSNQSLYTGISVDAERRFRDHCSGRGARFLRGKKPLRLVYSSKCRMTLSQALGLERQVKRWCKRKKELLVQLQPTDPRRPHTHHCYSV